MPGVSVSIQSGAPPGHEHGASYMLLVDSGGGALYK